MKNKLLIMKRCPKCFNLEASDKKFCPKDGSVLINAQAKCVNHKCKELVMDKDDYCATCGIGQDK